MPSFRWFLFPHCYVLFLLQPPVIENTQWDQTTTIQMLQAIFIQGGLSQSPSHPGKKFKQKPMPKFVKTCSAQMETVFSLGKSESNNSLPSECHSQMVVSRSFSCTPQHTCHLPSSVCFWIFLVQLTAPGTHSLIPWSGGSSLLQFDTI